MKRRCLFGTLAVAGLLGARPMPFITQRMTNVAVDVPEKVEARIAVNAQNPGSCDSYWLCANGGPSLAESRDRFQRLARFRAPLEAAGISVDFQQGVTLGHGPLGGPWQPVDSAFTSNAWQVAMNGQTVKMFCPRAPEVLAYEADWMAALGRDLKPASVWLDDDLRLGFSKDDGCFCARCLAAFNARFHHAFTREEIRQRVFGDAPRDLLRREWCTFLEESLACFAAAARAGMDRTNPDCILAYQSVDSSTLLTGHDYFPLLRALGGNGRLPSAIRIGSGCYTENVDALVEKMLAVAREAERCRASGIPLAQIAYEQETYRREILQKSAEAALVESALALASGCDSLTEYRWDESRDEPLEDWEEFARLTAAWRPYLLRLAALAPATHLGGLARFVGGDCDLTRHFSVADPWNLVLAKLGLAITIPEGRPAVFFLGGRSLEEWRPGDAGRLFANGRGAVVDTAVWEKFLALGEPEIAAARTEGRLVAFAFPNAWNTMPPTTAERRRLLDALDAASRGEFPVRIDRAHRFHVFPRVTPEGRTAAVTLYNGSAGKAFPTEIRIRRPAGTHAVWVRPCAADLALDVRATPDRDELCVTIPDLPARQPGTLFLIPR